MPEHVTSPSNQPRQPEQQRRPDVSVVIPTYKRPRLLLEAVNSVLAQTDVAVEVFVLDDCPEHSAKTAISEITDPRVNYVPQPKPSGGLPAIVRNAGFELTTAPIVHFLDDDDRVAPGGYRAALSHFAEYPDVGVVFGRVEPFGDSAADVQKEKAFFLDGARRARLAMKTRSRRWMVANMLFHDTPLVNSACMIRRPCFIAVGGYDPTLKVVEDVEFYIRAIRTCGFAFMDEVFLQYRFQGDSLMHHPEHVGLSVAAYKIIYQNYRQRFGGAELLAIKLFARTILRFL
jgi:glycosyltransferase involved in cell wall biosynthesis